ncbi:MAG TPA: carbohydrate porin [Rhizomicrobium sp.]|nr:carbohydrate porin [Rhizomicrobium sp.]
MAADSIDEVLGVASGGARTGTAYNGRFEITATIDLGNTIGWTDATFHTNAYWTHGSGLAANGQLNSLMTASNIEAVPSLRLFDLWIEQLLFNGKLSVRAGQLAADDEFFASDGASNFSNATFGWPAIVSSDLPSGGPIYDLATPGIRIKYAPSDNLSVSAALFNGDPAYPGPGDPQRRNANGLAFRLNGGSFVIGEAAYKSSLDVGTGDLPSTYKIGAWFHSGDFADQHLDDTGRSLASPASSGIPQVRDHDYGVYVIVDQIIWHKPDTEDNGIAAFFRGSWAPPDRNFVAYYADAGVTFKGLIAERSNDVIGIGFAFANISSDVQALDRDTRQFSGIAVPLRDYEATIEVTYHVQLNAWWSMQPDIQYIMHPGGNTALANGITPVPNATVIGLRSSIVL